MPDFLKDYQNYYLLRMKRYENNPDYAESFQSEKSIYEAIASCSSLEEFKTKLGNLNDKNAIALIIDQYRIRLKHYTELDLPVQAESCRRIIEKAAAVTDVTSLITMVNEENQLLNKELIADSIYPFNSDFLENIRIYEEAEIPEKYKSRYQKYADDEKETLAKIFRDAESNMRNYIPDWKFEYEKIWESRHRRNIPLPDEIIQQHIVLTKKIRNAG